MYEIAVTLPPRLREVEAVDPNVTVSVPVAAARQPEAVLDQLIVRLSATAEELQSAYRRQLAEMGKAAIVLATAVAGKLMHQKLEKGDFPVEALVRSVVEQLNVKGPVTVYLNPEDHALLERRCQSIASLGPALQLAMDKSLGRGHCRAEAAELQAISNLDEQVEAIRQHLLASLEEASRKLGADK